MSENVTNRDERILVLLGEMKAQIAAMREDMAEVKADSKEDREDSSESRRRVYERLEDGSERLTKLESTVAVIGGIVSKQTERIDKLEPVVVSTANTVKVWSLRGAAIGGGLLLIGGAIWSLITNNWGTLWRMVSQLITRTPS